MKKRIIIKRLYDKYDKAEGTYILIDRLWPRGVRKENDRFDYWVKDIAPSNELRKWFNHDPEKWEEFKEKYFAELKSKIELCREILSYEGDELTLVYGAKDKEHNQAVVLKEFLESNYKNIIY